MQGGELCELLKSARCSAEVWLQESKVQLFLYSFWGTDLINGRPDLYYYCDDVFKKGIILLSVPINSWIVVAQVSNDTHPLQQVGLYQLTLLFRDISADTDLIKWIGCWPWRHWSTLNTVSLSVPLQKYRFIPYQLHLVLIANPWPHVTSDNNYSNEFHAARYAIFKIGKRGRHWYLISTWYWQLSWVEISNDDGYPYH